MSHTSDLSPADMENYGIGVLCQKGCKEDRTNQDTFAVHLSRDSAIFGVFDGHGPSGDQLSHFAQTDLIDAVKDHVLSTPRGSTLTEVLEKAFIKCHAGCILEESRVADLDKFDASTAGSTATVVVVSSDLITVATVGDSRCILGLETSPGKFKCVELTHDQSPERRDERRRIESHGGEIRRLRGDFPLRVFVNGHSTPGLAMTRAIGDTSGTPAGIIPDPEVSTYPNSAKRGSFIVLASDGVWEFLSSAEVVALVAPATSATAAAIAVKEAAVRMWQERCPYAIDDITCIVAFLTYLPRTGFLQ